MSDKDLTSVRDRLKAMWADVSWLSRPSSVKEMNQRAKLLDATRLLTEDLDKAIDKRAAQTFGKSEDDEPLYKLLDGVIGTVEADSYAQHMLWREFAEGAEKYGSKETIRYSWKQETSGLGRQCGKIDGMPVMVSLNVNVVGGHRILFYHAMSRVVDHEMIRDWLKANLPPTAIRSNGYIENTDALNFTNILPHETRAAARKAA